MSRSGRVVKLAKWGLFDPCRPMGVMICYFYFYLFPPRPSKLINWARKQNGPSPPVCPITARLNEGRYASFRWSSLVFQLFVPLGECHVYVLMYTNCALLSSSKHMDGVSFYLKRPRENFFAFVMIVFLITVQQRAILLSHFVPLMAGNVNFH